MKNGIIYLRRFIRSHDKKGVPCSDTIKKSSQVWLENVVLGFGSMLVKLFLVSKTQNNPIERDANAVYRIESSTFDQTPLYDNLMRGKTRYESVNLGTLGS